MGQERFGRVQEGQILDPETGQYQSGYFQTSQFGKVKPVEGVIPPSQRERSYERKAGETEALVEREEALKGEQLKLQKMQLDLTNKQLENDLVQAKRDITEGESLASLERIDNLSALDLDKIYGLEEQFYPNYLYDQESKDMIADRNNIVANLELAAAGKLKGQGQVSEGERAILKQAATLLSDVSISPEKARKELEAAKDSILRTMSTEGGENYKAQKEVAITDRAADKLKALEAELGL